MNSLPLLTPSFRSLQPSHDHTRPLPHMLPARVDAPRDRQSLNRVPDQPGFLHQRNSWACVPDSHAPG